MDVKSNLEEKPEILPPESESEYDIGPGKQGTVVVNPVPEIISELTDQQTAVSPSVDDLIVEKLNEMSQTDTKGNVFDPDVHALDGDGNPSVTSAGKFRKKRKRKETGPDDPEVLAREKAAHYATQLFIMGGVTVFGEEWEADSKEEKLLNSAFDDYMESAGMIHIPPGLVLCVALSGYAARRIHKPQTQGKLRRVIRWSIDRLKGVGKRNKKRERKPDSE